MAITPEPATVLHGNSTACHDNLHGTPMSKAPRLGMGLGLVLGFHGMPLRSVEDSVVCRGRCLGRFAAGGSMPCLDLSRKRRITYIP